jgi:hypothetical protein
MNRNVAAPHVRVSPYRLQLALSSNPSVISTSYGVHNSIESRVAQSEKINMCQNPRNGVKCGSQRAKPEISESKNQAHRAAPW